MNQRDGDIAIGALSAASIFSVPVVDTLFRAQVLSLIEQMIHDGAASEGQDLSDAQVTAMAEDIVMTTEKVNQTTYQDLVAAFTKAQSESGDMDVVAKTALLVLLVRGVFAKRKKDARKAAEATVTGSYNYGAYTAALLSGKVTKTWISQRDSKVRSAHSVLDGSTVAIDQPFHVEGVPIRFPGDPVAPVHLVVSCRCFLRYAVS